MADPGAKRVSLAIEAKRLGQPVPIDEAAIAGAAVVFGSIHVCGRLAVPCPRARRDVPQETGFGTLTVFERTHHFSLVSTHIHENGHTHAILMAGLGSNCGRTMARFEFSQENNAFRGHRLLPCGHKKSAFRPTGTRLCPTQTDAMRGCRGTPAPHRRAFMSVRGRTSRTGIRNVGRNGGGRVPTSIAPIWNCPHPDPGRRIWDPPPVGPESFPRTTQHRPIRQRGTDELTNRQYPVLPRQCQAEPETETVETSPPPSYQLPIHTRGRGIQSDLIYTHEAGRHRPR